jgi:hypothetical protein
MAAAATTMAAATTTAGSNKFTTLCAKLSTGVTVHNMQRVRK